jgi:hypothetical protein
MHAWALAHALLAGDSERAAEASAFSSWTQALQLSLLFGLCWLVPVALCAAVCVAPPSKSGTQPQKRVFAFTGTGHRVALPSDTDEV